MARHEAAWNKGVADANKYAELLADLFVEAAD